MRPLIITLGSLLILGSQAQWISNPPSQPVSNASQPSAVAPSAPVAPPPAAPAPITDSPTTPSPNRADAATQFSFDAGAFAHSIAEGITNGLGGQMSANQVELLSEIRAVKADLQSQIRSIPAAVAPPAPAAPVRQTPKPEPPIFFTDANHQSWVWASGNQKWFEVVDPDCREAYLARRGLSKATTTTTTASLITAAPAITTMPVATADPMVYAAPPTMSYGTSYGSFGSGLFGGGLFGGGMMSGGSCGSGGCR